MIRKIATLMTGTMLAQAITFVALPIITRLYTPYDFGVLTSYSSVLGVILAVGALSYPMAIVLARNAEDIVSLAVLSMVLAGLSSLILFLVLNLWISEFYRYVDAESYFLVLLSPFAVFFSVTYQVARNYIIRCEAFAQLSLVAVISSLINVSIKALGGFLGLGYLVLVVSYCLNYFFQLVVLVTINSSKISLRRFGDFRTDFSRLKGNLVTHKGFAIYRTPRTGLYLLNESLPVFFLGTIWGAESAGYYSLARMVLGAPVGLVGQAIMEVVFPVVAKSPKRVFERIGEIYRYLIPALVFGVVVNFLFSEQLYGIFFGEQWVMAGTISAALSCWLFVFIFSRPIYACIPVFDCQKSEMLYEAFSVLAKALAMYAFYLDGVGVAGLIVCYSISSFIFDSVFCCYLCLQYKGRCADENWNSSVG